MIIHLLLVMRVFPEYVTLDEIQSKHRLIVLSLIDKLLLKVSGPDNVLEVLLVQLELYFLDGLVLKSSLILPDLRSVLFITALGRY